MKLEEILFLNLFIPSCKGERSRVKYQAWCMNSRSEFHYTVYMLCSTLATLDIVATVDL